jgi:hypothetical protein
MLPPALLGLVAFVPGRRVARLVCLGLALAVALPGEVGISIPLRHVWAGLWVLIAWRVGVGEPQPGSSQRGRSGGVESGAIGVLLGLAILGLLVTAVARQDLSDADARQASYGVLLVVIGLLQLMLRRDVLRAALAFGSLGLGLQVLEGAARDLLLPPIAEYPGAVLLATAVAVALAERLAHVRQRVAGTAWVSDAHDLHD